MKERYADPWILVHSSEFEFEEKHELVTDDQEAVDISDDQFITLEITPAEEGDSIEWDIYPLTSTQVQYSSLFGYILSIYVHFILYFLAQDARG